MTAPLLATTIASPSFSTFVGVVAGIYAIFALGLQLQFGVTGLLNFGHVAFMAISAYTMAILIVKVEAPMWAAAPAGIAVAMLFGLLIGLPTLRLRADYLAITTIAVGEIVRYVELNEDGLTGDRIGTIRPEGQRPVRLLQRGRARLPGRGAARFSGPDRGHG